MLINNSLYLYQEFHPSNGEAFHICETPILSMKFAVNVERIKQTKKSVPS